MRVPRTPKVNQQIRDERRAQILRAAADVFARNGYVGTRIDDIAGAAKISKGLAYHYFGSKETIFNTLIENAVRGTSLLYEHAYERPGRAVERLRWLVDQVMGGLTDHASTYMVVLQAFVSDAVPVDARNHVSSLLERTGSMVTKLIIEGQRDGEIVEGDPENLSFLFGSCVQGLASVASMSVESPSSRTAESLIRLFARES